MWATGVFHQVSLFSLKPADTTSTGGRSLLIPTPFSIKMALLDVALRTYGLNAGVELFPTIRDLAIAMSLPQCIIVNNCFVRILKPRRDKSGPDGKKRQEDVQEVEKDETHLTITVRPVVHGRALRGKAKSVAVHKSPR